MQRQSALVKLLSSYCNRRMCECNSECFWCWGTIVNYICSCYRLNCASWICILYLRLHVVCCCWIEVIAQSLYVFVVSHIKAESFWCKPSQFKLSCLRLRNDHIHIFRKSCNFCWRPIQKVFIFSKSNIMGRHCFLINKRILVTVCKTCSRSAGYRKLTVLLSLINNIWIVICRHCYCGIISSI